MSAIKTAILARLRQPSTYAGLAAVIASLGFAGSDLVGQTIPIVGTAVAGLLAVWLPEGK